MGHLAKDVIALGFAAKVLVVAQLIQPVRHSESKGMYWFRRGTDVSTAIRVDQARKRINQIEANAIKSVSAWLRGSVRQPALVAA